jgi:tellurite resistance protein
MGVLVIIGLIYLAYQFISGLGGPIMSGRPNPNTLGRFATITERSTETLNDGGTIEVIKVLAAGPFPVQWARRVEFVTSVFDVTDGEKQIVLAHLESAQEPNSRVFQSRRGGTLMRPDYGFNDWVTVGLVLPAVLQPPRSGVRKLKIVVRVLDAAHQPDVEFGFCDGEHSGFIWSDAHDLSLKFDAKGYRDVSEHEREGRVLALKVGVAVAMADGHLDPEEGKELKRWAEKSIHHLKGEARDKQRAELNAALTDAFAKAKGGTLILAPLLARLNEVGTDASKYEALDLCFDIMAADGVASSDEMQRLEEIARGLSLDFNEFNALRDKKLLKVGGAVEASGGGSVSAEQILGVDPSWDSARIREHLKAEFRKWNNRLSTLAAGPERDNAQKVLDAIAEVRKRHAE